MLLCRAGGRASRSRGFAVQRPTTLVDSRPGRASRLTLVACYVCATFLMRPRGPPMAQYTRDAESVAIMALAPVIPVLTVTSVEDGLGQARALVAGGLYAIEVTLRTQSALAAIAAIAREIPDAVVGAGTITSPGQIGEAVAAGARFLVSPGVTPSLAEAAAGAPVPFLPGCATASEAMALRELGFRALKLF